MGWSLGCSRRPYIFQIVPAFFCIWEMVKKDKIQNFRAICRDLAPPVGTLEFRATVQLGVSGLYKKAIGSICPMDLGIVLKCSFQKCRMRM